MKSTLFAIIFFVVSVFLFISLGRSEFQLIIILLATALGFAIGKIFDVSNDLKSLRAALAKDWQQRNEASSEDNKKQSDTVKNAVKIEQQFEQPEQPQAQTIIESSTHQPLNEAYYDAGNLPEEAVVTEASVSKPVEAFGQVPAQEKRIKEASVAALKENTVQQTISPRPVHKETALEKLMVTIVTTVHNYFTGGNLFVRIGIIILFFGVSFLLKYVSDRGFFPIEYRLIAVVIGAIFLLVTGWRLRHKNSTYGLLLQGAGVGILYLDIYAAYSMYHLIPSLPAFALMFVVSMFSAALAVMQDSRSLAILGFSGGFVAPILASSGSNNHVGLFSYYVILNIAIVAIAWFKAWRPLNLLGFAFTFIIGSIWGVFSYADHKFATTEPFLIIFFVFYVLIAVLFALRQPPKLKGYVDGTLLFGVPLAASALQYSLVKDFEYGVSLSAFAMGAFYMVLSWFIWKRKGDGLKLLAEAFLALGVIFASMAIPFALAPTQTAAAWGLEGLGLLWLGSRQHRVSVRGFGLLLQLAAGFFVIARQDFSQDSAFLNGTFISSMMMAIAGILSARLLSMEFKGKQAWENTLSPFLLGWGLLWLFGGFGDQVARHFADHWVISSWMILAAVVSFIFTQAALRLKPEWKQAWIVASLLLPVMVTALFTQFVQQGHPFAYHGWIAWPAAFASFYYLLRQMEKNTILIGFQSLMHTVAMLLFVVIVTLEGAHLLSTSLNIKSDWLNIWYAIPAIVTLWLMIKKPLWPFSSKLNPTLLNTGLVVSAFLVLWGLFALTSEGNSSPLPWMPLLNPFDITLGVTLISLFKWWQNMSPNLSDSYLASYSDDNSDENKAFNTRTVLMGIGLLAFLWLNFTLFRMATHWFGVGYYPNGLYNSSLVQSSLTILWAITGLLLTIYASRKNRRNLWMIGGGLLGLVVLKLFVIDLSELGSLARIISFLVVGALLTSIGYFAPLPESLDEENEAESAPEQNLNQKNQKAKQHD